MNDLEYIFCTILVEKKTIIPNEGKKFFFLSFSRFIFDYDDDDDNDD